MDARTNCIYPATYAQVTCPESGEPEGLTASAQADAPRHPRCTVETQGRDVGAGMHRPNPGLPANCVGPVVEPGWRGAAGSMPGPTSMAAAGST